MSINYQIVGTTAALLSAAAWAIGAIFYKKFGERVSSVGMNVAKGVINLFFLSLALLLIGFDRIDGPVFLLLGVSGLLGISLGDTFFFEALRKLDPHVVVLLSLLGQVLTVLFAVLFLQERLTLPVLTGIILVLTGLGIVLFSQMQGAAKRNTIGGIWYGLLSMVCMSISIIVAKKGLASVSAVQATFIRMLWGTAGLLAWGTASGRLRQWIEPFRERQLTKSFFAAVCLVSFGGFWLFHVALKYIDVSIANTLSATEPLFVIPLAALFLKQKTRWSAVLGTSVSVGGIVILLTL